VEDTNVPDGNALANKVKINLNMFGTLVLNRVGGEVDGEAVVQEHCVARSGPTSVGTTGPVSISVDDEVQHRGAAKKQAVVEGALEVPKDALRGREMGLTRVVYMEAHLLDHVGNVRPGEGEVLENPSQAAVGSRVMDGAPCRRRPWPKCRPAWSRACSRLCKHAQGCPKHTGASGGRGRPTAALLRRQGSGGEGRGPSSRAATGEL
jgi:hypothetical protein